MSRNQIYAVGYCRFSSDNQREESIDAQKRAIKKYAEDNDIIISKWYVDEGFSATNARRPEFQQMIQDSKYGEFNLVLVHKLDRFARNKYDSAFYKRMLKMNGVKLYSVLERIEDTPEGVIMESLLEGIAEYYSANLARETMKGLKENAYKGMCCGGLPPYGYMRVPRIVNGEIMYNKKGMSLHDTVIEPTNAEAVKLMFNMTLQGKKRSEIINKLNELGFKDYKGRPFKNTTSIDNILRNERYTGTYVFNKYRKKLTLNGVSKELNDESEIIRIKGGLPQIISEETFNNVQKILALRVHKTPSNVKENYLLAGKVICGECGKSYQGWKKETKAKKHVYYKCVGNGRYRHDVPKEDYCNNTGVRRDDLEDYVVNEILKVLSSETIVDDLFEEYHNFVIEHKGNTKLISNLQSKVDKIEIQMQNVINVIANGEFNDLLSKKLKELDSEKKETLKIIEQEIINNAKIEIDKDEVKKAFVKAQKILADKKSDFDKRKIIVNTFLNKVVVYKNYVEVYINVIPAKFCGNFSLDIKYKDLVKSGNNNDLSGDNAEIDLLIINNNINRKIESGNNEKDADKVTCISYNGSPGRIRTYDLAVNSRLLHHWATEEYLNHPYILPNWNDNVNNFSKVF